MSYTFKWKSESIWVVLTAIMTYAMTLTATDFENVTDWRKLAISIGAGLVRAVIGALLATRSGGFRPEVPAGPAVPTIDEQVGVSPRKVATPNQPDKPDDPLVRDFWDDLGKRQMPPR